MKIVADENIVLLNELFASHGEVISLPGRKITADDLKNADALLVRSVTTVDKHLLANSAVKFVGSCTIGTDHLDIPWLEQHGIEWAYAPGCNANAVVDYVMASLFALNLDIDVLVNSAFTVGIVGCGNVGSRLHKRLKKLGINTLRCDPFLAEKETKNKKSGEKKYLPLEDVISQSDMVCLHTPLTTSGRYPTFHLINSKNLSLFKEKAVLLNAGRGAVVDNKALLKHMEHNVEFRAVLDVWEDEPIILKPLLVKATIATPHIAGYSVEGKRNGSEMIYERFCDFFGISKHAVMDVEDPIVLDSGQFKSLRELVLAVYDPLRDSEELKHAPQAFDQLRKLYIYRREFVSHKLRNIKTDRKKQLRFLGFIT